MINFGRKTAFILLLGSIGMASSCQQGQPATQNREETTDTTSATAPNAAVAVPDFQADSAYSYIASQVAFGPRVPGSPAQQKCAAWLETMLRKSCDTVYVQSVNVSGGGGKMLPCINLIGSFHPAASMRILLLTHWDCRPWADEDKNNPGKPILAADDGGSGTAVLLELARTFKTNKLPDWLGVDLLLTDVEDYGNSELWGEESYCLGTQYWARHPHVPGYKAAYGILLDMVGARNARFPLEGFSSQYAGNVQRKIWQSASNAGFSSYFPYEPSAAITDDHLPVNRIAGIPTVDIIHLTTDPQNPFPPHWHTHADDMPVIDKNTLKAVGQTLLHHLFADSPAPPKTL